MMDVERPNYIYTIHIHSLLYCEWHSRLLLYVRQQIATISCHNNKHFGRKSLNINGIST